MSNDDREQRFEQAFARHMPDASPDSACPDAEILAAYHERTLSAEEMSEWKEHIAGCNRCQETLALVEETEHLPTVEWEQDKQPAERLAMATPVRAASAGLRAGSEAIPAAPRSTEIPLPISKARPRPPWRWIVPVGAIAASVIFVIGVQEIRTQRKQQLYNEQVAQNRLSIPQLPIPQSEPTDTLKKRESPAANLDKQIAPQKKAAAPPARGSMETESDLTTSVPHASSADSLANSRQKDALAAGAGRAGAMQSPAVISGAVTGGRIAQAVPTSPGSPVPAATAPKPTAEEKQQANKAVQSAAQTLQVQSAAPSLNTGQLEVNALRETGDLLQIAAGNRRYIVAPGQAYAWRLGDAGKIERSTDRGKTWRPQSSGVTADLTAGSATSDKVCWVVGKAGTLLLTADGGKHWTLLSSPIQEDLGGVRATDASHASIWNVTNRISYETADGGETWQRAANE
jgi:photosystem II stability/assembly factor-like uncharacterized protein